MLSDALAPAGATATTSSNGKQNERDLSADSLDDSDAASPDRVEPLERPELTKPRKTGGGGISGSNAAAGNGIGGAIGARGGFGSADGGGTTAMNTTVKPPSNTATTAENAGATTVANFNARPTVTVSATDPSAAEDGLDPAEFTVSRDTVGTSDLTVLYSVSGTAMVGDDYTALSGSVIIAREPPVRPSSSSRPMTRAMKRLKPSPSHWRSTPIPFPPPLTMMSALPRAPGSRLPTTTLILISTICRLISSSRHNTLESNSQPDRAPRYK